jgi:hypothetical protein
MSVEYRVVWKRKECRRKVKRFSSLKAAQRKMLVLGPEPWLGASGYRQRDPDSLNCCDGHQCGCNGLTVRQWWEQLGLPELEYIHIEQREVGTWTKP